MAPLRVQYWRSKLTMDLRASITADQSRRRFLPPRISGSLAEFRNEMADFCLSIGRIGEGVGDFLPEQFSIPLPQPVHCHFHGHDSHVELRGDLGVRQSVRATQQVRTQQLEQLRLAGKRKLAAQAAARTLECGQCATTVKFAIGRMIVGGFERESLRGILEWSSFFATQIRSC
jgi:hypothetical protein